MSPYIWKKRQDGINIINIGKTWEKLVLAARIIATIENPADVCVLSARPYGQVCSVLICFNQSVRYLLLEIFLYLNYFDYSAQS